MFWLPALLSDSHCRGLGREQGLQATSWWSEEYKSGGYLIDFCCYTKFVAANRCAFETLQDYLVVVTSHCSLALAGGKFGIVYVKIVLLFFSQCKINK